MERRSSARPRLASSFLVLIPVLLIGCARPQILHVDEVAPRGPRSPESVRLLLDAPDEPYRTIAVIRSRPQTLFRSLESLKEEVRTVAAQLGADAVLLGLTAAESSGGTGMAADGSVVYISGSEDLRVVGRAIIFTGSGQAGDGRHSGGPP